MCLLKSFRSWTTSRRATSKFLLELLICYFSRTDSSTPAQQRSRQSTDDGLGMIPMDSSQINGFSDEDEQNAVSPPKCESNSRFLQFCLAKKAKKTKSEKVDEIDLKLLEAVGSIGESLAKKESAGGAFGRVVATALDEMSKKKRMEAQLKIQQILLEYIDD